MDISQRFTMSKLAAQANWSQALLRIGAFARTFPSAKALTTIQGVILSDNNSQTSQKLCTDKYVCTWMDKHGI